jgi:hypothetical protein
LFNELELAPEIVTVRVSCVQVVPETDIVGVGGIGIGVPDSPKYSTEQS